MTLRARHLGLVISLIAGARSADAQRLADLPLAAMPKHASVRAESIAGSWQTEEPSRGTIELPAVPTASSRAQHVKRGALLGLVVYGALAGAYIVHESATCHGPECFGEGFAWIGLAAGVPISIGVGAGIGALWPTGRR